MRGLAGHVSAGNAIGGAAEIVVAEPYYEILEGWRTSRRRAITFTPSAPLVKRGVLSPAVMRTSWRAWWNSMISSRPMVFLVSGIPP
jgi:hypothetical protein